MIHNIEMSDEEQVALYLTLPPEEVAKMLVASSKHLRYFLHPVRFKRVPVITEGQWDKIEHDVKTGGTGRYNGSGSMGLVPFSRDQAFKYIKREVNQILSR